MDNEIRKPSNAAEPRAGYDLLVVGAGPAGLTCGMYAARAGLRVAVFEKTAAGGQLAQTDRIENYPGFAQGQGGFELAWSMKEQAERFGVEMISEEVLSLDLGAERKLAITPFGAYAAKAVVLATGARPRKLGLPGEEELTGRGVSYCATCDGDFFRDKTVAVIGGGNTAIADALYLSRIAKKVYLIHRRREFRATAIYDERIQATENIQTVLNASVTDLHRSNDVLDGISFIHNDSQATEHLAVDGLFVAVGTVPNTEFLADQLKLNDSGYIVAGETGETNIPLVFAAGDVREKELRQVVTAVADGAQVAETAAHALSIC
jgi:thioredoxin reductase (NADPH)